MKINNKFSFITAAVIMIGVFALIGCDDSEETSGSGSLRTLPGTVTVTGNRFVGQTLTAEYNGSDIPITYQWNRWGNALNNATNREYTLVVTGAYSVTVSAEGYKPLTSLVFRVTAGSPDEEPDEEPDYGYYIEDIDEIIQLLEDSASDIDNPIDLPVKINLGDMDTDDWLDLLHAINDSEQYVNLDLSLSTMSGEEFDPSALVEVGGDYIVSITLPNAAASIAEASFANLDNLKSVTGRNITSIGDDAFNFCISLTNVSFPKAAIIGVAAFTNCTSLTSVSFPEAIEIGERAFYECESLISVSLPAATEIGKRAFYKCESLISVSFPEATEIGEFAFLGCESLISVEFPKALSIEIYTFEMCFDLESVYLPAVTRIDDVAIRDSQKLIRVTLGTISEVDFSSTAFSALIGDLRDVYFAAGGGAGTYTRTLPETTWTKQ